MVKTINHYTEIREQLIERIDNCEKHLKNISQEYILGLKLSEVQELKEFCIEEHAIMTNILMVDLYHIIGMEDLTTRQVQDFYKLIKQYCNYRSTINKICNSLNDIYDTPKVPVRTRFKLLGFKNISLKSGPRDAIEEVEEIASLADYRQDPNAIAADIDKSVSINLTKNSDENGIYYIWNIKDSHESLQKAAKVLFVNQNGKTKFELATESDINKIIKGIKKGVYCGLIFNKNEDGWEVQIECNNKNKRLLNYINQICK